MSLKTKAKTPYEVWNQSTTHSTPLWVPLEEIEKARLDNPLYGWNWHEAKPKMTALELAFAEYIEKWLGDNHE